MDVKDNNNDIVVVSYWWISPHMMCDHLFFVRKLCRKYPLTNECYETLN